MSKLSLVIPTVGIKNTVACPEVDTALSTIQTWANGEVEGTNNIKAEGVIEANLDSATKTLLNTKSFAALTFNAQNVATFTAATGELVLMEKEASVLTLPAATANRIVGVMAGNSANSITVKAAAVKTIFGDFIAEATEITLAKLQHVILQATGTAWLIIAGEPKREQKYEAEKAIVAAETVTPSATRPAFVATTGSTAWEVGGKVVIGSSFFVPPGQTLKNTSGSTAKASVLLL